MDTILINGYKGKLGRAIHKALASTHNIIGTTKDDPLKAIVLTKKPTVIIDTTSSISIRELLILYQSLKVPTIIGTSGLLPEEAFHAVATADFPLIIVPNFSLKFQLFVRKTLSLPKANKITITETHHNTKADIPSSSSLYLGYLLKTNDIQSRRVNYYTANHKVRFHYDHEIIELTHTIDSPDAFIPGVLKTLDYLKQTHKSKVIISEL